MHKQILIISDNIYLCKKFEMIIEDLDLSHLIWEFSTSPYSDIKIFSEELDREVYVNNLKIEDHVEDIVNNFDLVFSIHSKQIFPKNLVNSVKCINIHPGYNPINRGWYPQVFAIINKTRVGATIHEIDEELDHGLIIDREFIELNSWDTSLTAYNKITDLEIKLLEKNLYDILNDNYTTIRPENNGNLYLKKDFNSLCEINLDDKQTVEETLNKLRALTHGEYKNAYYIDKNTNKKVYVSIDFSH